MLYINDIHGSLSNIDNFISARDEFYRNNQEEGTNWTVSAGDMFVKGSPNNDVIAKFIKKYIDVSAVGNHDLANAVDLSKLISRHSLNHKFLGANVVYRATEPVPLDSQIASSVIIEDQDERIGFIGVGPIDFNQNITRTPNNDFVRVMDIKYTVDAIREEVKKLEKQGVNKIVLLAHTGEFSESGNDLYKMFARIGGIDVIVGGHDHIFTDRWERSSRKKTDNSGEYEPVKIVSTGKYKKRYFGGNLDMFGALNLTFDDNGVLIPSECKNNVYDTEIFPPVDFVSKNLHPKSKVTVGYLDSPILIKGNPYTSENKVASLIADSDFWYVKQHSPSGKEPHFAFVNAGTVRDSFKNTEVTMKDIQQVLPFSEELVTIEISKKQVYETLEACAKSAKQKNVSPGLMQVSHLSYKISPNCKVYEVKILDDDGKTLYELDKMPDKAKFICVTDDFTASPTSRFAKYMGSNVIDKYRVTRNEAFQIYLNHGESFDIDPPRIEQY